ncbi:MAG TPA: hypothetical protein VF441_05645 [Acidimicrobiia bacterium]
MNLSDRHVIRARRIDGVDDEHRAAPDHLPARRFHPARHQGVAEELMSGLPADAVYKIMRGNAIRMLKLEGD